MENVKDVAENLSPVEKKVIPFINLGYREMKERTGLDDTSILRALRFLENKGIVKVNIKKSRRIDLGTNGIYYKKNGLPERRLLTYIEQKTKTSLEDVGKNSGLSENEFKVSLGVLKGKAIIDVKNGFLILNAKKEDILKKSLEEIFIESLPLDENELNEQQKYAYENLKKRKEIVEVFEENLVEFNITPFGKKVMSIKIDVDLVEELTPDLIKNWKRGMKFRKYDVLAEVPRVYGGRKHFVSDMVQKTRRTWIELGFREMSGPKADSSFWIFDALFTPQDHPAREMQDTFFIKDVESKLPEQKLVERVREAHEKGISGSKGWKYTWDEHIAMKTVLRTHTTGLSARKIFESKNSGKYFAIGKVFRNETLDSSHLFEFNQTEGIIIDENANFRELIGYLKSFLEKMGFKKIRFRPHYFPYTEPSVEADVYSEKSKKWVEILGAGILRPEVVVPIYGEFIPVLAWGMGLDRIIKEKFNFEDIRELYSNDIGFLRNREVV